MNRILLLLVFCIFFIQCAEYNCQNNCQLEQGIYGRYQLLLGGEEKEEYVVLHEKFYVHEFNKVKDTSTYQIYGGRGCPEVIFDDFFINDNKTYLQTLSTSGRDEIRYLYCMIQMSNSCEYRLNAWPDDEHFVFLKEKEVPLQKPTD